MKKIIICALTFISVPALASKINDAQCSDIVGTTGDMIPRYFAIVDGYNKAGKKVSEEVDMGGIVSESKKVSDQCDKDKTAKIDQVRKNIETTAVTKTSETMNPTKAKCKDFIALGADVQPVAAYWIAGHDKAGKLKEGVVEEEFLARPMFTLIEDCKNQPTASFYDRTKAWLKKRI